MGWNRPPPHLRQRIPRPQPRIQWRTPLLRHGFDKDEQAFGSGGDAEAGSGGVDVQMGSAGGWRRQLPMRSVILFCFFFY